VITIEAVVHENNRIKVKILPHSAPSLIVNKDLTIQNSEQNIASEQMVTGLKVELSISKPGEKSESYTSEVYFNPNDLQNPLVAKSPSNWKRSFEGFYLSVQNTYGNDLASRVGDLLTKKREKELIEVLHTIDPRIKDINVVGQSVLVDVEGISERILINSLGEGSYRIANILTLIYNSADGVVLIDEIETGLDRDTLRKLWKAVFEASIKYRVQIFATTHSLEAIDKFLELATEEKAQEKIRLIRLEKKRDHTINPIYFSYDQLRFSRNQGWEIR
jgi:AAA15 family ATPase/GTPase